MKFQRWHLIALLQILILLCLVFGFRWLERLEAQIAVKQTPVRFDHLNVTVQTPIQYRGGLPPMEKKGNER